MTLAGFMRGGGSTNMRLSRRHCWLPSRVAQQQQRQTIQQQALHFQLLLLLLLYHRGCGWEGGLRGVSPCLPLPTLTLLQQVEYFVHSVADSDR